MHNRSAPQLVDAPAPAPAAQRYGRDADAVPVEAPTGRRCHILGLDPGLQRTGYAVLFGALRAGQPQVREAGLIRLDRRMRLEQRLAHLAESVEGLLDAHQPALLACESLYAHYRHPRTAILMGHARGVILAVAARRGLPILAVAATNVKKVLTGSGHASKAQVQRAVAALLGLRSVPGPPDVADAIAIGLCGLHLCQAARWKTAARGAGA